MKFDFMMLMLLALVAPAASAGPLKLESNGGLYTLSVEGVDQLDAREFHALQITVNCRPRRCERLDLRFTARMPDHGHGQNYAPKVSQQAPGRFRVEGVRFHMPGYWEVYLDLVDRESAMLERTQFSLEL